MNEEQRKALARIVRRQAQFYADMPALISLLDTYESKKRVPHNWRKMWAELKKSKDYQAILEEFAPTISWLETSDDERETIVRVLKIA